MLAKNAKDRIKGDDASADPIGERRRINLDALPRVGRALAVQRLLQQELGHQTMASGLGPAKPRGIGCEGAGASVIDPQSRQVSFSRTCWVCRDFRVSLGQYGKEGPAARWAAACSRRRRG